MSYERLPESVQTLYAELLDQLIVAAAEATGPASGSFVSKLVKGRTYWYLQRSEGDRKRQYYLGPESPALLRWLEGARQAQAEGADDRSRRASLCRMLAAGGAFRESAAVVRVFEVLAEAGVFRLGGVVVGTRAFATYGNMLGIRFARRSLATQDLDIAQDPRIAIALAEGSPPADAEAGLRRSDLGFMAVPALDPRSPSTSFRIRGRDLRVDFLTPMRGRESSAPVYLPTLRVSAQPLRFLDYLIAEPVQAAVVGSSGILVNVPDPGRFAWHKLLAAEHRPVSEQVKARKDLRQARQLIEVLLDDRPSDLANAWRALAEDQAVRRKVLASLPRLDPELRDRLEAATGQRLV